MECEGSFLNRADFNGTRYLIVAKLEKSITAEETTVDDQLQILET